MVYQERIEKFDEQEKLYSRRASKFPLFRLLIFVIGALGFYFAFSISVGLAVIAAIIFLIVFAFITNWDAKTNANKEYYRSLKIINETELKSLQGNYKIFEDGERYIDPSHPYTSDLDIFGKASIFQFINRTTSISGSDFLAEMLKKPVTSKEIYLRQTAIKELSLLVDWRQEFQVCGQNFKVNSGERESILDWLNSSSYFLNKKLLTFFTIIFPFDILL